MTTRKYAPKDYAALRGLEGITDEQVEVHLQLYEGYVKRTNALLEATAAMAAEGEFGLPWQEARRRCGWEWNGMRLHEVYFDALRPDARPLDEDSGFGELAARHFGSVEGWKADLLGAAKMPGVGWVITYLDAAGGGRLLNLWVDEHHSGHGAGMTPLLALDVWEHAFSVYRRPTDRAKYLDDFYANVAWEVVEERLERASSTR